MYFYLGFAVLLYFAFILFPWWFSHGLARATDGWLLTPAACHSFESEYGEFGENSQNSANFSPCNSYPHQINHLGLFKVGRNAVFSTQGMVMFSTIRYFAVGKVLSFPHFTWPSRQHRGGKLWSTSSCFTDEELTSRVKLLPRNHTCNKRQQPSDCRWYSFSTLSLPPTWLINKVCRELVPICNGLPGGSGESCRALCPDPGVCPWVPPVGCSLGTRWSFMWTSHMKPHVTYTVLFSSVQLLSHVRLFDPMNCSTPGLPVHHQFPEFIQTHVHWVGDVIQPSHPLLSPSPPAFNHPQHQGLFQWVSYSHQVAKVLEFQLQHQSFQWIFRDNSILSIIMISFA